MDRMNIMMPAPKNTGAINAGGSCKNEKTEFISVSSTRTMVVGIRQTVIMLMTDTIFAFAIPNLIAIGVYIPCKITPVNSRWTRSGKYAESWRAKKSAP